MKKEYLEMATCSSSQGGFIRGHEYIVIGEDKTYNYPSRQANGAKKPCHKVVNKNGSIEIVILNQVFSEEIRILQVMKNVVYLGALKIDSLEEDELYSVINMPEKKGESSYAIFDGDNKLTSYPTSLFISETQYNKMSVDEISDFKKAKKDEILKTNIIKEQKDEQLIEEQNKLKKIQNINKLETEKMKKIIKAIKINIPEDANVSLIAETKITTNKMNSMLKCSLVCSILTITSTLFGNFLINSIIGTACITVGVLMYKALANKLSKSIIKNLSLNKKPNSELARLIISFNDDMLLKLKKIELNLLILDNGTTISYGTVSLIKESVAFCLESYKTKNANLLSDIDVFLDKTLEYTGSLIDGDKSAELYVEKQIYENVSSVINRNTDIFEIMISDNKQIKEILNKQRS